jgi:hypothetical protein
MRVPKLKQRNIMPFKKKNIVSSPFAFRILSNFFLILLVCKLNSLVKNIILLAI